MNLEALRQKADLNTHGSLTWISSCLQTSVEFLDLTISLNDNGALRFKTYQKAFNLYLYTCLDAWEHARSIIDELFMEAAKAFTDEASTKPKTAESPLSLHWEWHPRGLNWQQLCQAYNEHLQGHDGFNRLIIAYACPQNLRGSLTSSWLDEPPGQNASDFTGHSMNAKTRAKVRCFHTWQTDLSQVFLIFEMKCEFFKSYHYLFIS